MIRLNCWEYHECGREPGGDHVEELGVCPAAVEERAHGLNGGHNGGRVCWAIAGTLCGGRVQGVFAKKVVQCLQCKFYNLVGDEQGPSSLRITEIQMLLK